MGQLQYISTSGGSFECVLSATFTIDSVVEHKFLLTSSSQYIRFALGNNHINMRLGISGFKDMYFHNGGVQSISSLLTLNEVHTAMLSATQYMFDETTFSANATNLPSGTPTYGISNFYGSIYSSIVRENGVKTIELLPWINDNDVVGLYDAVSQTFYAPSSGTWTAGPPYVPPTPTSGSKIYLGSTNLVASKIKLGSNDVSAIYLGANQIYPPLGPIDYFRIVNVDSVIGDITFPQNATNLEYNIDGGAWVNPSTSSVTITLQPNEVLNMRAKSGTTFTIGSSAMTSTFMFDVEGNLATLINGQNPNSVTTIPSEFCRGWFRDQTKIRYADKLHLGTITTVGLNSMYFMFRDSSLVKGMDLSNITTFSATNGISTIYYGCTSLTEVTAPSIISTDGNMHRWLDSVSASGNCICPNAYVYNNMPVNSSTIDYGIPSGWTKSYDCRNWENEGYEDKGHCDCEFNYAAEGYTDEAECLCTEYQECTTDCTDCNNWIECGYESYEDCQCQQYGECGDEDITFMDYVYTNTYSFINTNIYPTVNTKFRVKLKTVGDALGTIVGYWTDTPTTSVNDNDDYRIFYINTTSSNAVYYFDFNSSRMNYRVSKPQDGLYDITCGNNYMYNNSTQTNIGTRTTQTSMANTSVPIYICIDGSICQINEVIIYEETNGNDVVVFDGKPANIGGVYGMYDSVSDQLLQPTDSSTVYGGTWQ